MRNYEVNPVWISREKCPQLLLWFVCRFCGMTVAMDLGPSLVTWMGQHSDLSSETALPGRERALIILAIVS